MLVSEETEPIALIERKKNSPRATARKELIIFLNNGDAFV